MTATRAVQAAPAARDVQAAPAAGDVQAAPAAGAVSALQAALAAEDAAIFGYGVAGAHLAGASKSAAEQDWNGHNEARDTLTAMISALGATPVAALAFYRLPFAVHNAATAAALAARLEDGVTRAYLGLVAVADPRLRTFGALAMQVSAERAAFWRGSTQAFPGLGSLAAGPRCPGCLAREVCEGCRWAGPRTGRTPDGAERCGNVTVITGSVPQRPGWPGGKRRAGSTFCDAQESPVA